MNQTLLKICLPPTMFERVNRTTAKDIKAGMAGAVPGMALSPIQVC